MVLINAIKIARNVYKHEQPKEMGLKILKKSVTLLIMGTYLSVADEEIKNKKTALMVLWYILDEEELKYMMDVLPRELQGYFLPYSLLKLKSVLLAIRILNMTFRS